MIRQIWATTTMATVATRRRSFTLTELLVTIAIISILMAIAWGAIGRVREQGRVAKTKSTIAKINQIVMAQYDGYRTRRVPIDTRGLPPMVAAKFRLWAIRCIMAWEMPDRLSDVYPPGRPDIVQYVTWNDEEPEDQAGDDLVPILHPSPALPSTALARAYYREFERRGQPSPEHSPAELLYLVVTLGTPGAREMFADWEIGDTDGDGYLEFLDGWGRPIYFMRCPAGFPDSDVQLPPDASTEEKNADHDPFDPLRVDPNAWRLVPLIYSAGPDGSYGLNTREKAGYFLNWNHWYTDPRHKEGDKWVNPSELVGSPTDNSYKDNIHNHRAETMP